MQLRRLAYHLIAQHPLGLPREDALRAAVLRAARLTLALWCLQIWGRRHSPCWSICSGSQWASRELQPREGRSPRAGACGSALLAARCLGPRWGRAVCICVCPRTRPCPRPRGTCAGHCPQSAASLFSGLPDASPSASPGRRSRWPGSPDLAPTPTRPRPGRGAVYPFLRGYHHS